MRINKVWFSLMIAALVLLTGFLVAEKANGANTRVQYLEIVCTDVAAQCAVLEQVHGLSFGEPIPEFGQARVAKNADGSMIGVRAPLAAHEQPIVRAYLEVEDIAKAVKKAQSGGAMIAYPPTKHGDLGTYAIYILNNVQIGLRQK